MSNLLDNGWADKSHDNEFIWKIFPSLLDNETQNTKEF